MNDDDKKILKEKLSALANDEELEKVAGGTYKENLEILNAMAQLDFEGVQNVFAKVNDSNNPDSTELTICRGVQDLIKKHFHNEFGVQSTAFNNVGNWYAQNGKTISHAQILKMINDKANASRG